MCKLYSAFDSLSSHLYSVSWSEFISRHNAINWKAEYVEQLLFVIFHFICVIASFICEGIRWFWMSVAKNISFDVLPTHFFYFQNGFIYKDKRFYPSLFIYFITDFSYSQRISWYMNTAMDVATDVSRFIQI